LRLVHGHRVVSRDGGAGGEQVGNQLAAGASRISSVFGLKASPTGRNACPEIAETMLDLGGQHVLLGIVGFLDGVSTLSVMSASSWAVLISALTSFGKQEPP
jgi:hypothetical protein